MWRGMKEELGRDGALSLGGERGKECAVQGSQIGQKAG